MYRNYFCFSDPITTFKQSSTNLRTPRKPQILKEDNNFNRLMYPVIVLAQVFALMPISNVSKTGRDIKFKFISIHSIYYILICIGAFAVTTITMLWIFHYKMEFGKFGMKILKIFIITYSKIENYLLFL